PGARGRTREGACAHARRLGRGPGGGTGFGLRPVALPSPTGPTTAAFTPEVPLERPRLGASPAPLASPGPESARAGPGGRAAGRGGYRGGPACLVLRQR